MTPQSIHEKLVAIQSDLKAPKDQTNAFGKYKYRSCEDILEAVKPLLKQHEVVLTISDEIVEVGGRVYVKATAKLSVMDSHLSVTAFAREALDKKGMDEAQITGAASSYARKYALNGLFCIDDTKDSDATNQHDEKPIPRVQPKVPEIPESQRAPGSDLAMIAEGCKLTNSDQKEVYAWAGVQNAIPTKEQAKKMKDALNLKLSQMEKEAEKNSSPSPK